MPSSVLPLGNWHRGERRYAADRRCTRRKRRRGDNRVIPLGRRRAPVMHVPVKVFRLGYGFVKPSVRVCRKATTWFSSWSVMARLPVVMSRLFLTSGIGQQVTFSIVPGGQCPDVTGKAYTSRVL